MSTTDRITQLDTRREITDRVGQTVILGNSVGGAALDVDAGVVAASFGATSEATSNISLLAAVSMAMDNGSFGIWAVYLNSMAVSLLRLSGAAIAASRFNDITTSLLSWGG